MPKKTVDIMPVQAPEVGGTGKMPEDTLDGVIFKGVLEKVARHGFNSKRLCVLSESKFCYFNDKKEQGTLKQICLANIQAVKRDHSSKGYQFEIITEQRTETFAAASLELCEHWLNKLQSTLLNNRRRSSSQLSPVRKQPVHSYEEVDLKHEKPTAISQKSDAKDRSPVSLPANVTPVSKQQIHSYEEVELERDNQSVITGNRSDGKAKSLVSPPAVNVSPKEKPEMHLNSQYETVDLVIEDKPRVSRGLCTTVDVLGGPPGGATANKGSHDQPNRASEEPPVYSLAKPVKKPRSSKLPKPEVPSRNTYEVVDLDTEKVPLSATPCDPSNNSADPGRPNRPQCEPPASARSKSPPPIYSEAPAEKTSDLYSRCRQMKASKSMSNGNPDKLASAEYSTTYSQVNSIQKPDESKPEASNDAGAQRSIYCLAGDINGKKVNASPIRVSEADSDSKVTNTIPEEEEEIYDDAQSVMQKPFNPNPDLQPDSNYADDIYDDAESCLRNDKEQKSEAGVSNELNAACLNTQILEQVSHTTSFPSLKYGPVQRHPAINKLEEALASEFPASVEYSTVSQTRVETNEGRLKKLRTFLNET